MVRLGTEMSEYTRTNTYFPEIVKGESLEILGITVSAVDCAPALSTQEFA